MQRRALHTCATRKCWSTVAEGETTAAASVHAKPTTHVPRPSPTRGGEAARFTAYQVAPALAQCLGRVEHHRGEDARSVLLRRGGEGRGEVQPHPVPVSCFASVSLWFVFHSFLEGNTLFHSISRWPCFSTISNETRTSCFSETAKRETEGNCFTLEFEP